MLKYSNMGIGSGFLKNRNWIRNHSFSSSTTPIFCLFYLRAAGWGSWGAAEQLLSWADQLLWSACGHAAPYQGSPGGLIITWLSLQGSIFYISSPSPPPPPSLEEVNMVNGVNGEEWGYVHKISYMHTKRTYNKCVVFTLFHIPVSVKCICSIEKNVIF